LVDQNKFTVPDSASADRAPGTVYSDGTLGVAETTQCAKADGPGGPSGSLPWWVMSQNRRRRRQAMDNSHAR